MYVLMSDDFSEGRFAFDWTAGWHSLWAAEWGTKASETVLVGVVGPERSADVALFIAKAERTVRVHIVSAAVSSRPMPCADTGRRPDVVCSRDRCTRQASRRIRAHRAAE